MIKNWLNAKQRKITARQPVGILHLDGTSRRRLGVNINPEKTLLKTIQERQSQVTIGSELKALGDGKIGGHLILFSDETEKDLDGQFFTKDTYYGHNQGNGAETIFNHRFPMPIKGLDPKTAQEMKAMSKKFLSHPLETTIDAIGIFAKTVMDMADEYEKMIYDLVSKGKIKWSAASAAHLIDVAPNGHIKSFVITEGSLTPAPKEFRMLNHTVVPLKSLLQEIEDFVG